MGDGPIFLIGVGATKAGTTWLYEQLRAHPGCRLRTIKEYHYFTMKEPQHWAQRIAQTQDEIDRLSAQPDGARSPYQAERLADLRAWLPVLQAGRVDMGRYRAFHTQGAGAGDLVGDITPAYALMPGRDLAQLAQLGAGLRVVFLIRDPLARLWSHIRMNAARSAPDNFAPTATDLLRKTLAGESGEGIQGMVRRGDYRSIIPKLRRVFDAGSLLVQFAEDMMTQAGFARLLAFLGRAPMPAQLDRRVHEGRDLPFPEQMRAPALRFLRPQYDYIASEFSALPQAWRRNLNEALA